MTRRLPAIAVVLASLIAATAACADPASDKAAITERLRAWTAAFNARDAAGVCDLFAPDLVATIPEAPDESRDVLCKRLAALFVKPGLMLHYDEPNIREIVVSGDLAVVRLFWTLTARRGAEQDVTKEAGIDIFRRQPDGTWSIARFLSFSMGPNKVLQ